MISETGMRDLTVGQALIYDGSDGKERWILKDRRAGEVELQRDRSTSETATWELFDKTLSGIFSLAVPDARIYEGLYRHRAAGPDDVYYVKGVGILDKDGHGNPDAPRQVFYESTRSVATISNGDEIIARHSLRLANIRSEAEFGQLVTWPDGIVRPRFVRMEYSR